MNIIKKGSKNNLKTFIYKRLSWWRGGDLNSRPQGYESRGDLFLNLQVTDYKYFKKLLIYTLYQKQPIIMVFS